MRIWTVRILGSLLSGAMIFVGVVSLLSPGMPGLMGTIQSIAFLVFGVAVLVMLPRKPK